MHAFIQKTCIWLLSMVPFAIISYISLKDLGPQTDWHALISIGIGASSFALSLYIGDRWCGQWNLWDQQEREQQQIDEHKKQRQAQRH